MTKSTNQFKRVPTTEHSLHLPSIATQRSSYLSVYTSNCGEEDESDSPLTKCRLLLHINHRLQSHIYTFLERPSGIWCFLYHFTVFGIVIGCLLYSSILTIYNEKSYALLFWIELVLFILFLIEYIVRVWSAGCRTKYQGHHGRLLFMRKSMCILDLIVILGYAILLWTSMDNTQFNVDIVRYIRILQILRFLHVDRRLTSWRLLGAVVYAHRYELVATLYFCFIFLIVVAYLIWLVEKDASKPPHKDMFHSFADTLWWAIVTMTTIGYGDKCPRTHIGKLITSCLCICGVAFWTLPSGIIGSGFALQVEEKKREKQINRLVPAAASLIQRWWRLIASRSFKYRATWRIYRIEVRRPHKLGRFTSSAFAVNASNNTNNVPNMRAGQNRINSSVNGIPSEKVSWRRVERPEDLTRTQITAIQIIRVLKYHIARRKFVEAHKPYDFKDIVDENSRGNIKIMYAISDIQRRLDQSLGFSKSSSNNAVDKDRENVPLNTRVNRLEKKLSELEEKTNHAISLLEELCQRSRKEKARVTMSRIAAVAEELTSEK